MNPLFSSDDFKLNKLSQHNQAHINGNHQNEHVLCYFWRHINLTYFRKLGPQELERFNYILSMLSQPFCKIQEPKYSDYTSFFIVKNCLDKTAILKKIEKKEASNLYYRTLLKHIKLSNLIYNAHQFYNVDSNKLDTIYSKKQALMKRLGVKNLIINLAEETRSLDQLIGRVEKLIEQKNGVQDQIEEEIFKLEEEFKVVNRQNIQRVNTLENGVSMNQEPVQKKKKHWKQKSRSVDSVNTVAEIQLEFLKKTILKLESRQVADSMTKIVQTQQQGNAFGFSVALEQALNPNFQILEESLVQELDKMRDISLFKFYNIPQKTRYSHISHNVQYMAIQHIAANRLKPNTLQQRNLVTMMKQQAQQNQPLDQITSKFDSCHHCRMLFREENLMACNYRSGTMGLPIINSSITDSYMFQQVDSDNANNQNRRFISNRKRNTYSMYARKNGELMCSRKFCRQCLKQCYEHNLLETAAKNDWVCPFCQGICYCIRCQRNDILTKLKGMYMLLGGNMQQLQDSSLLEKYVRPQQEEFFFKKKQQLHGFQRTGCQFFRQQFNSFKSMQQVRVDFENLRHLCSCTNKREKFKIKDLEIQLQKWVLDKNKNIKPNIQPPQFKKSYTPILKQQAPILKQQQQPPVQKQVQKQQQIFKQNYYDDKLEESLSSQQDYDMVNYKFSKAKKKFEEKQKARIEKTKRLIARFYGKNIHNPNSPPEDIPVVKLKRELSQLILTQDTETYNLVVKKIKNDEQSL